MTYSDVLWENASGDVGVTWPSVTSGSHGTTVLHFVLLLRKNAGKTVMRRTYFRSVPPPMTSAWRHFRSKVPTRTNIALLPVAHAQNILPDMTYSGDVTSSHVTYGHMTSGCSTTSLHPYTTDGIFVLKCLNFFIVLSILLIISGIEINPGPFDSDNSSSSSSDFFNISDISELINNTFSFLHLNIQIIVSKIQLSFVMIHCRSLRAG
jgi:hypothetical protein